MDWLEPDSDELYQIKYNLERLASNIHPTPLTWASTSNDVHRFGIITRMWCEYTLSDDGATPENVEWYVSLDFGVSKLRKVNTNSILIRYENEERPSHGGHGFYGDDYGMPTICDI